MQGMLSLGWPHWTGYALGGLLLVLIGGVSLATAARAMHDLNVVPEKVRSLSAMLNG
jgi:hypothetical protein